MSELEDRLEIEYLHTIFAHAVDRRDFALARSLYTDDAIDNHGMYNGPVDGYIEWAKGVVSAFEISAHIYSKPLIAVAGDTAESETRGQVFVRIKGPPPVNTMGVFRHFDKYVRTTKGWRFSRRSICSDWSHTFPAEVEKPSGASGMLRGTMDPDDPSYAELPLLAAELRMFAK